MLTLEMLMVNIQEVNIKINERGIDMDNVKFQTREKWKVRDMVNCSLFTVLIIVGAFIKVPIPVCPFTLQFFFTNMAGIILGGKKGAVSVLLYILIGLLGLPVFAAGGGIGYVFQPTFGYMIGFVLGTFVTGKLVERNNWKDTKHVFLASLAGLLLVYAAGMLYYYFVGNFVVNAPIGIAALFLYCFVLAVPGDILLCILSAVLTKRVRKIISNY